MAKKRETQEERMSGLAALCAISEAISGSLDIDETLNKALEKTMEFLGVEIGAIFLLDDQKRQAQLMVHRGLSEESVESLKSVQVDEKIIKRLTEEAKRGKWVVIFKEVFKRTRLFKNIKDAIDRERLQCYLPIILRCREDILGGMVVASREPREFTPEEIGLSIAVGRQVGVAIENARLYQEQRRRLEERQQAEQALRGSEERYRTLFERTVNPILVIDTEGNYIDCNEAALQLLECTRDELLARNIRDFIPPGKDREVLREHQPLWESGGTVETEYYIRGKVKTLELTITPVIWLGKGVVFGVGKDITERKRAEEAVRESHQLLERTFASLCDAVFIIDANTVEIIDCNPAASEIFGYSRDEILGRTTTFLHVDEAALEEFRSHLYPAIEEKGFLHLLEFRMKRKDGTIFPTEHSVMPLVDEKGNRTGWVSVVRDITERKRAEEALRESGERFRTIVETAPSLLLITDTKGNNTYVSPNCQEITGYSQEELQGRVVFWVHEDDTPRVKEVYDRTFREGVGCKDVEYKAVKKNGELWYGSSSWEPIQDAEGKLQGVVFQTVDITERKRAEEARQRLNRQLAALLEIVAGLETTASPTELATNLVRALADRLGYPFIGIWLLEGDVLKRATEVGYYTEPLLSEFAEIRLEQGIIGRVARTGQPAYVPDVSQDSDFRGLAEIRSEICCPLRGTGGLMGVLDVESCETLTEADFALVKAAARLSATALSNAQLFGASRRQAEELAALNAIALAVTSTLDLQEVLQAIQERVMELLGERYAPIFALFNEGDQTFEVVLTLVQEEPLRRAEKLAGVKLEKLVLPLSSLKPAVREGLLGGKPYMTSDGSDLLGPRASRRLVQRAQKALGVKCIVDLPLWVKGKFTGSMVLFSQKEKISDEEMELLSSVASQAAIAIENARLYEKTDEKLQRRVAELIGLNAIAESLTSTLELDEILESLVTCVAQVMRARICTIRLVEGNKLTIGAAVGYRDESSRQHTIEIDQRLAHVVRDQQPLMVEDLWQAEDIPPSRQMRAWREEVRSFLGVPMISKKETIGVLSIYREEPHRFTQGEISLLLTIANQAAIAIENARLYERVREHAEELERLVQARTRELQAIHVELLKNAKLAALGQLAAGVAHELNNPLGAISGYLELLQEEMELEARAMDYTERIEKRVQQATKIVAELKSLGIPSEPAWHVVNVNDILEETLNLVERRLSLHQIKVQRDLTPNLPLIDADPDRMEQVFINLITNAKQAMGEGGTLKIASRQSQNGEWVEIIFADTGEGIAKAHLTKIFDPFFTTRSPGKGMGLGLSLSHRHIRDHGGAIDVWSEKGKGSVFRVALPPSGAKRCWEILHCEEKEQCKAVRENADYRCWSVMEDVSRCERCEVYRRKALPPLDGTLLPQ